MLINSVGGSTMKIKKFFDDYMKEWNIEEEAKW